MSIPGWATTDPLKLCACVRSRYLDVIEGCGKRGVRLQPIETMRDLERQRYYLDHKVSKTLNSKHLPQEPHRLSLAVDAAPKSVLGLKNWGVVGAHVDPAWLIYTDEGRKAGLECGADWYGINQGWDWPHLQLSKCLCT